MRKHIVVALAIALVSAAAGCGGGSSKSDSVAATATTPTTTSSAGPQQIGATFFYAGWEVGVDSYELVRSATGSPVVRLAATFKNHASSKRKFTSSTKLKVGTREFTTRGPGEQLPELAPAASGPGTFEIVVDDRFAADDAVFDVADYGRTDAQITLANHDHVTLEPAKVTFTGTLTTPIMKMEALGGEIRADDPLNGVQSATGQFFVYLAGGFEKVNCADPRFLLTLDQPYKRGEVKEDAHQVYNKGPSFIRFPVAQPGEGDYVLHLKTIGCGSGGTADLKFTVVSSPDTTLG